MSGEKKKESLRYKVLREHYKPVALDHPDFNNPIQSKWKFYKDFDVAVVAYLDTRPAKIKGTDKKTVVETLLTAEEDGRMRPLNREEREHIKTFLPEGE